MQQALRKGFSAQGFKKQLETFGRIQICVGESAGGVQCRSIVSSTVAKSSPAAAERTRISGTFRWLLLPAAAFAAVGIGSNPVASEQQGSFLQPSSQMSEARKCLSVDWVQNLARQEGSQMVLSADTMHSHPLLRKDHMFSELHHHEMVKDLICFYNAPQKSLNYVIQLGRNICGFPSIMHGGLTAAIIDESFGFLWLSLRANNQLPFKGPAFTAHLEVEYKKKIPAGKMLVCTTEVESCEGRKLWMKATVQDKPTGQVYATARALFVRPKTQNLIQDGVKYAYAYLTS